MNVSIVDVDYVEAKPFTESSPLVTTKIVNGDIPVSESILKRLAEIGFTKMRTLTAKNTFAHRFEAACVIQSACDHGVIVVVTNEQNRAVNGDSILHARIITSGTKTARVRGAIAVVDVDDAHTVALPGSHLAVQPLGKQGSSHLEVSENAIGCFRRFAATVFLDDRPRALLICSQESIQRKIMRGGVFFWVSAVGAMAACLAQTVQVFTDCTKKNSSTLITSIHCSVYFVAAAVGLVSAVVTAAAFSYRKTLVRCAASLVAVTASAIGAALTVDFVSNIDATGLGPLLAVGGASVAWLAVAIVMVASVFLALTRHGKVYYA